METYKDITGYEGAYQVSNLGNVRSKDREVTYKNGRVAKYKGKVRRFSKSEYRIVLLSKVGKVKGFKICRLVATHFIENKRTMPVVNHIDGNKYNDKSDNLEWCTYSENSIHSFDKGMSTKKNKVSGVFFEDRRGLWASYLYRGGKNIFCGRFETELEAVKARGVRLDAYR